MNELRKSFYGRMNHATVLELSGGGVHYQSAPAPKADDPRSHYPYTLFEFVGPSRPAFTMKAAKPAVEKFLVRVHCYAVDRPAAGAVAAYSGAERAEAMAAAVVERFAGDGGRRLQLTGAVAEVIYAGQFPLPVDGPGFTVARQIVEYRIEVLSQ